MKHVFTVGCLPLIVSMAMASLQTDAASAASADGEHSVVERGPHHRVWERVEQERQPDGRSIARVRSYTELSTGLYHTNSLGELSESREEITILPNGGAAARHGQHKVLFPPTLDGQIELNTPDGKWLRSRVLGLAYEDADGKSVLIAEIKPSVGTLVGSNVMVYADAFDGVSASLRYTYTLAAFEQDVVIQGQLPLPEKFGLTDNVKVQVLTEFDAPEPQREVRELNGLRDEYLRWGVMQMGRGTAFALGEEKNRRQGQPIGKRWEKLFDSENGGIERTFLIEEVDYRNIEPQLRNLPVRTAMNSTATNSVLNRVASKRLLPAPKLARHDTNTIQLAKAEVLIPPGYVLDYTILNMGNPDFIFLAGTTYYLTTGAYFYEIYEPLRIQGGTVIKFAPGAAINPSCRTVFETTPQNPAYLTAVDDDTVGEVISGSTGEPSGYYATCAFGMDWGVNLDFHDLEIRYATWGIIPAWGDQTIRNCRFIHVGTAIWGQVSGTQIKAYNVLFENVVTAFGCNPYNCGGTTYSVDAQHVTYHDVIQKTGSSAVTLTELNCLFDNDQETYATGMFGGNSYLAETSSYRNAGTTAGVDPDLLTAIRTMTTYAPQHGNYPDTDPPDLGYHYLTAPINAPGGFMVNLEKTPEGYLRINPTADTSPMPFVNLANSGRGSVTRIEIPSQWNSLTESKVVGEYYTAPNGRGRNPSRTTVDRYGNVWVGNRDEGIQPGDDGSIAQIGVVVGGTRGNKSATPGPDGKYHIVRNPDGSSTNPDGEYLEGPFIYNTCIDRDGDGLIRTSAGLASDGSTSKVLNWNNAGGADSAGGVSTADDEAILRYVRVVPTEVRSIAVDKDNNVWVGSKANGWQEYVDGITGVPMTGWKYRYGAGGYGGLVDGYGTLWSSGSQARNPSWNEQGLLRLIPDNAKPPRMSGGIIPQTSQGYGIGIDPLSGDVWLGNYEVGTVWRFSEGGCQKVFSFGGTPSIRGIVVDGHDNVWIAQSDGTVVHHLRTSGEYIGAVPLDHPSLPGVSGAGPFGVSVDADGMIWAVCYERSVSPDLKHYAMRIDPSRGTVINGIPRGETVEAVGLGNEAYPYNYSDMTGFVTMGTTKPSGFWDFVQDSGVNNTLWTRVGTVAEIPSGADVVVEVRAANHITELPSWPFQRVQANGSMPSGIKIKGRYLEVRVTLLRDFCPGGTCAGPELRALHVESASAGSALTITSHPASRVVAAGGSTSFSVTASGATGYQWYKDGQLLAGKTSASLPFASVQCTDAGVYYVRVSNAANTVQSAPARLHVKGAAPELNLVPGDLPVVGILVNPGTPSLTITAHATVSGSGSCSQPPHFQWMHDQLPIPGASGVCTELDGANGWKVSLTLNNLQREHEGYYSVVFSNAYGSVLSSVGGYGAQGSLCKLFIYDDNTTPEDKPVYITPYDDVADPSQPVTLTADPAFAGATCAQWYKVRYDPWEIAEEIPGANALTYTAGLRTTEEIYKIVVQDFLYQSYEAYARIRLP